MIFLLIVSLYILNVKAYPCKGSWNGTDCNCYPNFYEPLTNCSYYNDGTCETYAFYSTGVYLAECQSLCINISIYGSYCNLTNTCIDQCINDTCTRINNTYNGEPYCKCNDGYEGEWCDSKIQEDNQDDPNNNTQNNEDENLRKTQITVSIIGSVVGVLGIGKYYHNYRQKKKFEREVIRSNNVSGSSSNNIQNNKLDNISDTIYEKAQATKSWLGDKLTRNKDNNSNEMVANFIINDSENTV